MSRDKNDDAASGDLRPSPSPHSVEGHVLGGGFAMPQVDDPGDEGHMWSGKLPASGEESGIEPRPLQRVGGEPQQRRAAAPEPAATREVILVTGSSGLIGAAVSRWFSERFHVVAFDNPGPPYPPPVPHAHGSEVNLISDEDVQRGLRAVRERFGERIASVIHLAVYYNFTGEPSRLYEDLTVRGTERLLRGLRAFQVEQFIFSSTMLVHAPGEPGVWINEDWPLDPKWDYPKSKVETEDLIRAQHGDIPAAILRISGVYDDDGHTIMLAQQMQRIYERQITSHLFPGSTAHGQAWLHLDDLVDAIALLVERRRELPSETTLLLGEPEALSYDEIQHTFGRLIHGASLETHFIAPALAKTGTFFQSFAPFGGGQFIKPWMIDLADDHYALDITRARTLLGWEPKRSLRQTLPKMVEALKTDPLAWYRDHKLTPPPWLEQTIVPERSA